ncbi:hypothetical protein IHV25_03385 [Phaeovibrio sulfidiphilus]|uniref:Lipoprotein n=1 Tax=Phaeovibrio sulfidiphilus TaxID=1220600 RepID=A0A8J6YLP9_9PROT|nr:hypothetical protein [Phaeovibrio sulfidiphilus]MBE1236695.1 hypothetical protein [Phaeovibrio sulfidiphilus]
MKRTISVLMSALLLALAGCETEGSRSPDAARWGAAGQDTAARERAFEACREYAEDEALRGAGASPFDTVSSSDPLTQMRAYDTRRTYQRVLKTCMERRGYGQAPNPARSLDDRVETLRDSLRW